MARWPTTRGVMALGDDREATLELGRQLAGGGQTSSVVVYTADQGQDRSFVSALRAVGSPEQLAPALKSAGAFGIWETEFRHVLDCARAPTLGKRTPGISMFFACWRNPDWSHEQFSAHWRDIHAPLAVEHHPGMEDYTQCELARAITPDARDYDGVAILQFDSIEDYQTRMFANAEGERIIGEDVARFGDMARLDRVRMHEYVLR